MATISVSSPRTNRRKQGLGDDRAASVLFGEPLHRPVLFQNLRSWTPTIGMPERIAAFVRHTSFTRPVYLTSRDLDDIDEVWDRTSQRLRSWGLFEVKRPVIVERQRLGTTQSRICRSAQCETHQ